MKSSSEIFEDFSKGQDRPAHSSDPTIPDGTTLEEHRIEAFEQGYKAGWDDAAKAQSEDQERIAADLAQNLNELSFTYTEAQTKILSAMEPLLRELVETVLPQIAAENIGGFVLQELNAIARNQTDIPTQIIVAPETRARVESVLPASPALKVEIVEEPTLGEGQVLMRLGSIEKQIDLMDVLDRVSGAVSGFFDQVSEEKDYG